LRARHPGAAPDEIWGQHPPTDCSSSSNPAARGRSNRCARQLLCREAGVLPCAPPRRPDRASLLPAATRSLLGECSTAYPGRLTAFGALAVRTAPQDHERPRSSPEARPFSFRTVYPGAEATGMGTVRGTHRRVVAGVTSRCG
jgi:hypothetical protein